MASFHNSIISGDLPSVESALISRPDLARSVYRLHFPLRTALESGQTEVARFLIRQKYTTAFRIRSDIFETLDDAAFMGNARVVRKTLDVMTEAGLSMDMTNALYSSLLTPILKNGKEIASMLISIGKVN